MNNSLGICWGRGQGGVGNREELTASSTPGQFQVCALEGPKLRGSFCAKKSPHTSLPTVRVSHFSLPLSTFLKLLPSGQSFSCLLDFLIVVVGGSGGFVWFSVFFNVSFSCPFSTSQTDFKF